MSQRGLAFRCVIPLVLSLLAVGPALAASKQGKEKVVAPSKETKDSAAAERQAQEKAARKACLSGDYAAGVAALSNLFVETRDPTYIYNQGRCFEQNRRYEDAIARFQEFLRAGRSKLEANDKAEAEQHIADCRQMLAQERGGAPAQTTPVPFPTPPPTAASPPPPASPQSPIVIRPAAQPAPGSSGAGLRVGGIVVASLGVAAVGTGLLLNLKANSMVDDMYGSVDGYSKESDRKDYETIAWVGYGVGAACVATGVILYTLGVRAKSRPAGNVALVPTVAPDHAGAALTGAF
jgi:hypothetical protein